jgi:hypothetical protein
MARVLVVANETIGGRNLLEALRHRREEDADLHVIICVPRTEPRHGAVIYDEAVFQAAQVRVDLARAFLRENEGIDAVGEVGDPDPYTAAMDAVREFDPDEIIVSTKPATISGWLRRDLVERIADATSLPVEHVVSDIEAEGLPFTVTLVVANRTSSSGQLRERLKAIAQEDGGPSQHLFICVVPQEGGLGNAALAARGRLNQMVDRLRSDGLLVAGMIGDPDPYTATMNGLQAFRVDDVVISTLGAERSGWLRADLVERVKRSAKCPVEHVVAERSPNEPAQAA